MNMKDVKAIFLDMDGTILNHDNQVEIETKETIDQLRQHGFKVCLATGRSYEEIERLVPEGFDVDGIISSNGTRGQVGDETIFKHRLTTDTVQRVITRAQENHVYYEVFPFEQERMVLNGDKDWVLNIVRGGCPTSVGASEWASRKSAIHNKMDFVTTFPNMDYSKIYFFSPDLGKIAAFRQGLVDDQETLHISVSNSSRCNAEVMAYGVDKGTGIKEMIAHFGIKQTETLVIGDSDNDRAMFDFGHYTVAMKNARPEIQALTGDVTAYTNDENGAARYLAQHLLNVDDK